MCTPALLLDLAALERNLAAMAAWCDAHGVALRPHAKTHKSVEVARRQLGAGAVGVSVATIGEAERLTDGGIGNLLITSPLATPAKRARLRALLERAEGLMVVADSVQAVDDLAETVAGADRQLIVLIDLGVGRQRTGCASTEQALAVARRIAASNSLSLGGVQAYAGHLQHTVQIAERRRQGEAETAKVGEVVDRLRADGLAPQIVSGAGTGSHAQDAAGGLYTEMQCGSYVFMDVQYQQVDAASGRAAAVRSGAVRAYLGDQRERRRPRHHRRRAEALRDRRSAPGDRPRRPSEAPSTTSSATSTAGWSCRTPRSTCRSGPRWSASRRTATRP